MKIALVGTGSNWDKVPPGWDIWCVPGLWGKVNPARVYEVHSGQTLAKIGMSKEKLDWMKAQKMHIHPSLQTTFPDGVVIDYEAHLKKYGKYFTSSISWMLAEAIEEKPEEIGIFGVSMSSEGEYAHQKPACSYLIGWARASGIKVTIPESSELLAAPWIYGYQDKPAFIEAIELRKRELITEKDKAEDDWVIAKARYHEHKGALEVFDFFENNWWSHSKGVK